ncbi:MAG: hypothetical protein ACFFDW_05890 [Candidatus Thorarchaeota archaeon]
MKYKNILPAALILTIIALSSINGPINATATVPLDELLLYMSPDIFHPYVGDSVNVTVIFKHALNTTSSIYNTTITIDMPAELNITAVNNISSNMTDYDLDDYYSSPNSTEAIFWWDNSHINVTWAKFDSQRMESFSFKVNITDEGNLAPTNFIITYILDGETITDDELGIKFYFPGVEYRPTVSQAPVPIRGELTFFWWLAGSVLIVVPLIVIIITRITLWKR